MDEFLRRSWLEIDLDHLEENYRRIRSLIPPTTKIMAVVKADGYGCGDVDCARALEHFEGDWYGVSNIQEAMAVRGVSRKPILILSHTPPEYAARLAANAITQTIVSLEHARLLAGEAEAAGIPVEVHINFDTGMNRVGLLCYGSHIEEAVRDAEWILQNPWLKVTGAFTHITTLYELDEASERFARGQFESFLEAVRRLEGKGYSLGLRHCCNSAGILNMPELTGMDMVRAGTILYGVVPGKCKRRPVPFDEVLSIKSTVIHVKDVEKGRYFSYSMSGFADRDMRVATVPIGYGDGYRRGLSNLGRVLVNGVPCPIKGRVCMDQVIVDVTGAGDVRVGQEVVLLGGQGDARIPAEEIGGLLQTGPSEIYCLLTKRLPRIYIKQGKPAYRVEFQRCEGPI